MGRGSAAEGDDALEFGSGEGHHGETALADERDFREGRLALDLRERDGVGESGAGLEFDGDPAGFVGGGIGEGAEGDLGETLDGFRADARVEEHAVAGLHGAEMNSRLIIADAGPRGAAVALESFPSVGFGFGFHEPVLRFHGGGGCVRTEMDADAAEKAKARRAVRLLYVVMTVFILAPLLVAYFFR